jgi:hypothetical protein
LLRARRRNAAWHVAGVLAGLLLYTYYAAAVIAAYAGLLMLVWAWRDPTRRRGIGVALLAMGLIALPLLAYHATQPASAARIGTVAVLTPEGEAQNALLWLQAFFYRGQLDGTFNLVGRPIFDPFLGALFIAGLVALWFAVREQWQSWWIGGLGLAAVLPSLLSQGAPHFLRAGALVLPIALTAGAAPGRWS